MRSREAISLKAFNIMGAEIDWSAIPVLADMLGLDDVEQFVVDLVAIRAYSNEKQRLELEAKHGGS